MIIRPGAGASRRGRGARGVGGGGGAVEAVTLSRLDGWGSSSAYYETAADDFFAGGTTLVASYLLRLKSASISNERAHVSGIVGGRGFRFEVNVSGVLRGICADGGGTQRATPTYTPVAGDVDKDNVYDIQLDSGTLRLYRAGAEVGSGTAMTGYTAPTTGDTESFGAAPGGTQAAANFGLCGLGEGATTIADHAAHYAATKALGDIVSFASIDKGYSVKQDAEAKPATWSPFTGSGDLVGSSQDSLTAVTGYTPDWI